MTNVSSVAADTIQEIVVEDNEKTTSDTVELIAKIEVGDDWTPEMVDVIKTRLVSSGLFKDVEVFYEPVSGGVRVHMLVRDKHSWVIAPAFYTPPTNVGGGIGYGENNLFGLNQKLLIYAQIATGDTYFVGAWVVPSIAGTRFYTQVDSYDKHARNIEYAAPTKYISNPLAVRRSYIDYYNVGLRLGYDFYKGIVKLDTRLRTARVSYSHVERDHADDRSPRELVLHRERRQVHADVRALGAEQRLPLLRVQRVGLQGVAGARGAQPRPQGPPQHRPRHAVPAGISDRRHLDARLVEQPVPRRLPDARQRRVLVPAVRDLRPRVSRPRVLGFRVHDVLVDGRPGAQLPAEQRGAGVEAVQELGRRRHAVVPAPDRAAAARARFRLRARSARPPDLSRHRAYGLKLIGYGRSRP